MRKIRWQLSSELSIKRLLAAHLLPFHALCSASTRKQADRCPNNQMPSKDFDLIAITILDAKTVHSFRSVIEGTTLLFIKL